jgi:Flp pilus assembly protein TadB
MLQGLHNSATALLAALLLMGAGGALIASLVLDITSMAQRRIIKRLSLVLPPDAAMAPHEETDILVTEKETRLPRRILAMIAWAGGRQALRLPLAIAVGVAAAAWLLADYIFLAGFILSTVVAVGLAVAILIRLLQSAVRRRQLAFLDYLPEAIDLIVRAASAGIPITEAIAVAGREVNEPVGSEFGTIAHKMQFGVDLKDALYEASDRVNLLDFDCFVVALVVQRETGGQLAETMRNLATITRRRKETRSKAKSLSAEGRLTAKIVASLPLVAGAMVTVVNPGYMLPLITDPSGRHMLLVAVGAMVAGFIIISRMTKMEL